jgi:hypothetical protein
VLLFCNWEVACFFELWNECLIKYSETNVMHILLNLLIIKGLYMFRVIPVGARFFAHVQTGTEAHPSSCTMRTGSFPGVKRPERDADRPPPSSAEVKKD